MVDIKNNQIKKDWRRIEFLVPIQESISDQTGKFLIRGPAIHETTTRNGTTYIGSELQASAETLRDKPILKDHNACVDSIVGRTTMNVSFNDTNRCVDFEGQIMDEKAQRMIKDGRIKNVSVGAFVRDIEKVESETGDDMLIARGIDFVEISLVAVPADPNAGFAMAMAESWNEKNNIANKLKENSTETDIPEEKEKEDELNTETEKPDENNSVDSSQTKISAIKKEKIVEKKSLKNEKVNVNVFVN